MGDVAKFATVSDHYFRRRPEQRTNPNYSFDPNYKFDSDDAEVTIPGAGVPGLARADRRAWRPGAGQPDDRRRDQQPDELDAPGQRVQRRAPSHHAEQPLQRRRVRRHLGCRDDDGRVPGAAALVRRERHVSVQDLQGRADRRGRGPGEGRDLHARGFGVLHEEPDPEGPAGPVRDVRDDERERRELPRVPPGYRALLEQHHGRRRRPVAHVHHGHPVRARTRSIRTRPGTSRPTAPRSARSTATSRTP